MRNPTNNFVIIDNDSCHNIACALSIKKIFKPSNINIIGFTNVRDGIAYLRNALLGSRAKTVLFLDINMPFVSGWKVLETLDSLPKKLQKEFDCLHAVLFGNYSRKSTVFCFLFCKRLYRKTLV